MVSLDAPERAFRRRLPGAPIRYVGFSTSPEWLRVAHASASSCRSPILAASHLDIHRWRPALGLPGQTTTNFQNLHGDVQAYAYWLAIAWSCAAVGEELIFGVIFSLGSTSFLAAIGGHGPPCLGKPRGSGSVTPIRG
jgi:hypothetical protein